ncbi:MAG: 1-acyl-sn-glycerol-3-phosphate acyltransferase [Desulfomonilaceae bacterium]
MSQVVPLHLRGGRFHHVAGVLDEEPPWLLRKLIPLLSANVRIDDQVVQTIRDLAQSGPLVYAMKYRSVYDLQFLRMRFAELGLPIPSFVFGMSAGGIGSFSKLIKVWKSRLNLVIHEHKHPNAVDESALREILEEGGAGVMFLVDEKTSRSRYVHPDRDPLQILLDLQGRMAASIVLAPMSILYDRTARRAIRPFWESFLGDPDMPGPIKRLLIAIRKWTVPELLVGEPINLVGEFEEFGSDRSWDELPFDVRQKLIESINARIRVNRGPERLSRTEIKERVLQDSRLHRTVREKASGEGTSEQKVRKKAESYIEEIAADQRIQALHFLFYLLKWLFTKVFDGIDLKESTFATLKKANAEGSLIFVSCHKSHFDYLLIGFLSFINQMAVPYMAAGKNLSFWPVGPLLRHGGAFFLRRSFKGLGLYTHVFAAYVKALVREKVNINFYIEGGRSRTGKLMPPRVGMLAFLLQAVEEGAVEDLTFVPCFIGYDQIPEERSYLRELAGRDKQAESFLSVIRAREILKRSFGKVYARFDNPISFRAFCENPAVGVNPTEMSLKENRKLLHDFAYHLMHGIVRAGVVTPIDLAAAGLVCMRNHRVDRALFFRSVGCFSTILKRGGFEFAESLGNRDVALEQALGLFRYRGFVALEPSSAPEDEIVYVIDEQKRANLEFYKNSLVNYLWPASFLAILLTWDGDSPAGTSSGLREEFQLLSQLCSKELIVDPLSDDDEIRAKTLGWFHDEGWVRLEDDNQISVVNREALESLRGIMSDILEIYYLALVASETVEQGGVALKEFMKKIMKIAQDLRGSDESRPLPSLSSVTVSNALARFFEMGILEYRPSRKYLGAVTDAAQREKLTNFLGGALRQKVSGPDQDV